MTAWVSFGAVPPVPGAKPVLLSPKAAQTVKAMGAPMKVLVIVPPPVYTNVVIQLDWSPVAIADSYNATIGTNMAGSNFVGTTWSSNTTSTTIKWNIRVLDNVEFFYAVVRATNGFGSSGPSAIARGPDWLPNAVRLSIMAPGRSAQIQVSQNLKSWINTFQGAGPWTNAIQFDKNQFYRAVTAAPAVAMSIEPVRLWNKDHFGR